MTNIPELITWLRSTADTMGQPHRTKLHKTAELLEFLPYLKEAVSESCAEIAEQVALENNQPQNYKRFTVAMEIASRIRFGEDYEQSMDGAGSGNGKETLPKRADLLRDS